MRYMSKHEFEKPRYKLKAVVKDLLKAEVYERAGGKCEHPQGCEQTDITKLTLDHFTPQAVARIWEWTPEEVNNPLNLLLLCRTHHDEKDYITNGIASQNAQEFEVFKPWARKQRKIFAERQRLKEEQESMAA